MSYDRAAEVYDWAGHRVKHMVLERYDATTRILDVGAGQGKYRELLRVFPHVDACEVWEPYVDEHDLRSRYRQVHIGDVVDLVTSPSWDDRRYDLVLMGDVLEHLTRTAAQHVVDRVLAIGADIVAIVPFEYPQDEEDGNVYQRHVQDDLTPELMATEYPELRLVALETRDWRAFKGMYVGSGRG